MVYLLVILKRPFENILLDIHKQAARNVTDHIPIWIISLIDHSLNLVLLQTQHIM